MACWCNAIPGAIWRPDATPYLVPHGVLVQHHTWCHMATAIWHQMVSAVRPPEPLKFKIECLVDPYIYITAANANCTQQKFTEIR